MKNRLQVFLLGIILILSTSCGNKWAKNYGGTTTVTLENEKLINITWKEESLWIVTRPLKATDTLETYKFHEHTGSGFVEGTVKIVETRKE